MCFFFFFKINYIILIINELMIDEVCMPRKKTREKLKYMYGNVVCILRVIELFFIFYFVHRIIVLYVYVVSVFVLFLSYVLSK